MPAVRVDDDRRAGFRNLANFLDDEVFLCRAPQRAVIFEFDDAEVERGEGFPRRRCLLPRHSRRDVKGLIRCFNRYPSLVRLFQTPWVTTVGASGESD